VPASSSNDHETKDGRRGDPQPVKHPFQLHPIVSTIQTTYNRAAVQSSFSCIVFRLPAGSFRGTVEPARNVVGRMYKGVASCA
jgi:hypothetical protein